MLRLRPYKPCDAQTIIGWCRDERSFRKWSADRYPHFPITPEDMNAMYHACDPDCREPDNFFPMTAFDEDGAAGHLILRFTDEDKRMVRIGYVIVDDAKRGRGYGSGMLRLAVDYAFRQLCAEKVTLGVFENNDAALRCYQSVGFRLIQSQPGEFCELCGEKWRVLEMELAPLE